MSEKLLTLIIPCYNMEKYLLKCVGSLGIDGLRNVALSHVSAAEALDVIIVNDGSKDQTSACAHELEKNYPNIVTVLDKANGHYGSCINAGLAVAKGRYVKILEPDDTYHTQNFAAFLPYLESMAGQNVDIVFSDHERIDEGGRTTYHSHHTLPEGICYPICDLAKTRGCKVNPGITYRVALLRDCHYRQSEGVCYSDTEWYLIPLASAKTFACFGRVIYRYFRGRENQSMSREQFARNSWMMAKVVQSIVQWRKQTDVVPSPAVEERIQGCLLTCLRMVYTSGIIGPFRHLAKVNLAELDLFVKNMLPDAYVLLGDMKWSTRVPYHFIAAWRRKSRLLPLMRIVCLGASRIRIFAGRVGCCK